MEKIISLLQTVTYIIFREGQEHFVYWIEKKGKSEDNIYLNAAPIQIASQLDAMLFKTLDSVTMTSATISVEQKEEKGFQYFTERIGLSEPESLLTGSPFDYENNVTIHIPENMLPVNNENHNTQSIAAIKHYVNLTQGGCLILFTSYSAMERAFLSLQHQFQKNGYKVLCQGKELSRSQLVAEFKTNMNSVLFGTDSFWEGVDIPGDALRNVIITKLPFSVPSHPIVEAKNEFIESQGKNPFMELSLPEAIIKFKQGFGRLIRTKKDKGIVCILDTRIITKVYGKKFLKSIPHCHIEYDQLDFVKQI
jgi:ATP-dependent DNA helicase DinG